MELMDEWESNTSGRICWGFCRPLLGSRPAAEKKRLAAREKVGVYERRGGFFCCQLHGSGERIFRQLQVIFGRGDGLEIFLGRERGRAFHVGLRDFGGRELQRVYEREESAFQG